MAGEERYIRRGSRKLRCGYTTGSCAAGAARAAALMLLSGRRTEEISLLTPMRRPEGRGRRPGRHGRYPCPGGSGLCKIFRKEAVFS